MKYVVVYDISNPKRLAKVSRYLEKIGFRVQNSTFELDRDINNLIIDTVFQELIKLCETTDKIFLYKIKNKVDLQLNTNHWDMVL